MRSTRHGELNSSFYAIPTRNTVQGWWRSPRGLHLDGSPPRALAHSAPVRSLPAGCANCTAPELEPARRGLVEETAPLATRPLRCLPAPSHSGLSPRSTSSRTRRTSVILGRRLAWAAHRTLGDETAASAPSLFAYRGVAFVVVDAHRGQLPYHAADRCGHETRHASLPRTAKHGGHLTGSPCGRFAWHTPRGSSRRSPGVPGLLQSTVEVHVRSTTTGRRRAPSARASVRYSYNRRRSGASSSASSAAQLDPTRMEPSCRNPPVARLHEESPSRCRDPDVHRTAGLIPVRFRHLGDDGRPADRHVIDSDPPVCARVRHHSVTSSRSVSAGGGSRSACSFELAVRAETAASGPS